SHEVVTKFLLKCSNKFSNSGAFDSSIKFAKMLAVFDDKNCQAHFEILRARLKSYDDYDFINYEGNIKELSEYKIMNEIATKNNNTAFLKKIALLLKHQSQPKNMKTKKGFPRRNFRKKVFNTIKQVLFYTLSIGALLSILILFIVFLNNGFKFN
ncbi:MAG: hypothetical protein IJW82_03920, partial [Clostridia bacterium]|nr:hypothetical protein [Clostridia bacterium]